VLPKLFWEAVERGCPSRSASEGSLFLEISIGQVECGAAAAEDSRAPALKATPLTPGMRVKARIFFVPFADFVVD
jgi:hypothetical protein